MAAFWPSVRTGVLHLWGGERAGQARQAGQVLVGSEQCPELKAWCAQAATARSRQGATDNATSNPSSNCVLGTFGKQEQQRDSTSSTQHRR
jgi:hypothetical protein